MKPPRWRRSSIFSMARTRENFPAPQLYPTAGCKESHIPYNRGWTNPSTNISTPYADTAVSPSQTHQDSVHQYGCYPSGDIVKEVRTAANYNLLHHLYMKMRSAESQNRFTAEKRNESNHRAYQHPDARSQGCAPYAPSEDAQEYEFQNGAQHRHQQIQEHASTYETAYPEKVISCKDDGRHRRADGIDLQILGSQRCEFPDRHPISSINPGAAAKSAPPMIKPVPTIIKQAQVNMLQASPVSFRPRHIAIWRRQPPPLSDLPKKNLLSQKA